jgi:hypothetical protein
MSNSELYSLQKDLCDAIGSAPIAIESINQLSNTISLRSTRGPLRTFQVEAGPRGVFFIMQTTGAQAQARQPGSFSLHQRLDRAQMLRSVEKWIAESGS